MFLTIMIQMMLRLVNETYDKIMMLKDERIIYVKNDFNIGVPFVYKKWINSLNSKYFMIIGEGDVLFPNSIEKMIDFLELNPSSSMVHGLEIKNNNFKEPSIFSDSGEKPPYLYLHYHLMNDKGKVYSWSQASAMFRKEFLGCKTNPLS